MNPCLPSARHHLSGRRAKKESERLINETGISPLRDGVKEVTLRNFHDRQDPSLATSRRSENNCSNTVNHKKKKYNSNRLKSPKGEIKTEFRFGTVKMKVLVTNYEQKIDKFRLL